MKRSLRFLLGCLLLAGSYAVQAQIIYLTPMGAGDQTGNSWAHAAPGSQLQNKISGAASGTQLWVAKGTYQPAENASFTMKEGVKIYGGFASGATSLSQRDFTANPTILKGNGRSVISNNINNLSASAVLDGFTITGGDATGSNGGGGMYNSYSSPTIINCTFSVNSVIYGYGGGMYNDVSSPIITNCTFYANKTSYDGGGMFNYNSFPIITNCTFYANSANEGGGMYNVSSSPSVTNCIIWGNTANSNPAISNDPNSMPAVTYSIVQGGYSGTGNLDADPQFVNAADPNGADNVFGTADDGLKLQAGSPAINTGNNAAVPAGVTTDITGAARIQGNIVDMGAYENTSCPASPIVYVDSAKATSGDGSSWANAYKTLTEGLAVANRCTNVTQVWVAKGTYQPAAGASFTMVPNVKIYGGFASGATLLSQRNFTANPTILRGNGRRVISNENNGLSASAVLDGFTITGGGNVIGGGMANFSSSPTVTNCTFYANAAINGGGMYNDRSSPTVTNCTFSANTASDGGGMYNSNSSPSVTNCTFSANTAGNGGGMSNGSSSPIVTNCTFSANTARNNGGGMYNTNSSSSSVTNCIIWGNTANADPAIFGPATVTYSIVQGGYPGTNNLDKDPLFVNATTGDLQLQPCSPAINRGLNAANNQPTDIAGNNRIQVAIIDLGAYESPYDTIPAPRVTINANPGSTICAGTPVMFTASPVNGGSAPAYQWKKNGTIVSTSSTYSTSALSNRDTITVTLTNTTSCSYPLIAADTLIVTVNPAPGKPMVTASGPTTFCPGGSVMLSAPAGFASYLWSNGATTQSITVNQSGSYSVMVKNSNGCSSPASDLVTVTVADNEKPVITCPAAQQFCYSTSTYTIPALQATDNCSIQSTTYSITGATTRSGTGNNASGAFAPGTSTITWTVRDASNNMSTCSTTVKVNSQILVTIADSKALNSNGVAANTVYVGYSPASSITLTANASGGSGNYTYQWSNGKTTQSITVSPTTTTTYTVTVKDGSNCTGTASKTINVVDVRCGNKMDKVSVCHNGNTLCISDNAVDAHLNHGDMLGACGSGAIASRTTTTSLRSIEEQEATPLATIVYPNPNKGQFSIQLNSSKTTKADVQVLNAQGIVVGRKVVQTGGKSQTVPFSLNNPAAGTYLIKIVSEEGVQVLKMIVQP